MEVIFPFRCIVGESGCGCLSSLGYGSLILVFAWIVVGMVDGANISKKVWIGTSGVLSALSCMWGFLINLTKERLLG